MEIVLGVVDASYEGEEGKTTGEVAQILEDKYHPMFIFYLENEGKIGEMIANSMARQIERKAAGHGVEAKPFFAAEEKIAEAFRDFLDADIISGILPMTQQITAAQMGVSHRKKHPYSSKNKARPALIDTGLYQQSFKAWVEK